MPDLSYDVAQRQKKQTKALLPPGGAAGRVLQKASSDDYDAEWMPIKQGQALPDGGTIGQVLTKRSYVDGDADWEASSFGTASVDAYLDTTGISIAGGTQKLPWVIDPGTAVTLPSAGLLDLSTPDTPVVIADGYFTFDMYVAPLGGAVLADPVARVLYKIERGVDVALFQPTQTPATAGGGGYTNANGFSFSYPCLAGDVVTVQLEDNATNIWALGGSVKSIT